MDKFSPMLTDTLQYLNKFITSDIANMSPEELCLEYQSKRNDACIAAMFKKMFGQINSIFLQDKYFATNLSDETKTSEILSCIEEIMLLFDTNKNIKFITLFTTCLHRRLYAVAKPYRYKCRNISKDSILSYESCVYDSTNNTECDSNKVYNFIYDYRDEVGFNHVDTESIISNLPFSDLQFKIANIIISGGENKDAAAILNVTTSEISKELKKMRRICVQNNIQNSLSSGIGEGI